MQCRKAYLTYLEQNRMDNFFIKLIIILGISICVHFVFMFIKWNKSKTIREELQRKSIKSFTGLTFRAVSVSSGGFLKQISLGISQMKVDLIFTKNEIHFIPSTFSIFLFASILPIDVNRLLDDLEIRTQQNKVKFFFKSNTLDYGNEENSVLIKGDSMKIGELVMFLNDWLHKNK